MKVILLDNISNLGNKHDIKDVANGYGRNFLLPKGLAKLATKSALIEVEKLKKTKQEKQKKELTRFQILAKKLDGQEVEIPMKIGEDGTLYGSVTNHKIAEVLQKKGFDVTKEQLIIEKPIKGLGEYDVVVKFPHNLEVTIRVIVMTEKK